MSGVCAGPLAPRRVLQLRSGNSSSAAPALALFGSVAGLALAVGGLELLASSPLLCHSTVSAPLRWRRHASDSSDMWARGGNSWLHDHVRGFYQKRSRHGGRRRDDRPRATGARHPPGVPGAVVSCVRCQSARVREHVECPDCAKLSRSVRFRRILARNFRRIFARNFLRASTHSLGSIQLTTVVPLPDGKRCSLGSFAPGLSSAAASTAAASPAALATPS
jgi:hypothetical protein